MISSLLAAALIFVSAPDGDTLTVRDGNVKTVLRLAEVDAPERTQPYSQISRRNLIALCKDKAITFQPVRKGCRQFPEPDNAQRHDVKWFSRCVSTRDGP